MTIKKTVSVGLAVTNDGRALSRRTTIMVINFRGGAAATRYVVASTVGDKTSCSAQEVVAIFGPTLLWSFLSPLRRSVGSHIEHGISLGRGGVGGDAVPVIFYL